jgi:hypothetical protein
VTRWTPQARQSLAEIQQHAFARLGVNPKKWCRMPSERELRPVMKWLSSLEEGDSRRTAAALRAEFLDDLRTNPPPTEFESPGWHLVLARLCERIEMGARFLKIEVGDRPLFASLPSGRMNAFAYRAGGPVLTLFNVGLFGMLNGLSKLLSLAFPFKRTADGKTRFAVGNEHFSAQLLSTPGIKHRFVELFRAYIVDGDMSFAPRYLLGKERLRLQQIILKSAELFVVGHEYGHVINGDLTRARSRAAALAGRKVSELHFGWRREYQADARGLEIMIQAMRNDRVFIPASVIGAGLFFAASHMMERIAEGLRSGSFELEQPNTRSSHPPPVARELHLRDCLNASLPRDDAQQCCLWLEIPSHILTMLFHLTKSEWQAMHQARLRPAQLWEF